MLNGSMSSARSRLGYTRGQDSTGIDRAILGFGRGATRNSLGVVRHKRANGANPLMGSSHELFVNSSKPDTRSRTLDNNDSCTIPARNRTNPRNNKGNNSEHLRGTYRHSMYDTETMKRNYSRFQGGDSRNKVERTKRNGKVNEIRDMFTKYKNSDDGAHDGMGTYNITAHDFLSGKRNKFGGSKRFVRSVEEPEPEVYTFGPTIVSAEDDDDVHDNKDRYNVGTDTVSVTNTASATNDNQTDTNDYSRIEHLEKKWDKLLEMLDNKFTALTSKSDSLEKIVEKLATMQLSSASTNTTVCDSPLSNSANELKPATHTEQHTYENIGNNIVPFPCYGIVSIKTLPLFYTIPSPELKESSYVKECECEAEKDDMIKLVGTRVQPGTQSSWYEVNHTDEDTGDTITLWTPSAIHNKPCFEEFKQIM